MQVPAGILVLSSLEQVVHVFLEMVESTTRVYAGTLIITDAYGLLYYEARGTKAIDFASKHIEALKFVDAFVDNGLYMRPCYCCGEADENGILDIRVLFQGSEFHIGIMTQSSEAVYDVLEPIIQESKLN